MKRTAAVVAISGLGIMAVPFVCLCLPARSAQAGVSEQAAKAEEEARARILEGLLRRSRSAVVLLKTDTGLVSGVVLDAAGGIIATSKARLLGAGRIDVFAFRLKRESGRVIWERTDDGGDGGAAGVYQDLDADVSGATAVEVSLEVFAFGQFGEGAGKDGSDEAPARLSVAYLDEAGEKHRWEHGFICDGTSALSTVTSVKIGVWSGAAFDLMDDKVRTDSKGRVLPRPVKITRVTLWGNGVDFNGGAANVVLRKMSGAAAASAWSASLLADGKFERGFGVWKKFQSNRLDEVSIDVHRGREYVERQGLGRAEVTAIHRSADAALLMLAGKDLPSELSPFQVADLPGPGAEVAVAGVVEAVRFEHALDLRTRAGAVLEHPAPTSSVAALSAPTHLNNAGGAVLDLEGRLVGIASFVLPGGAHGAATPLARFGELRAGSEHAMPREEVAGHLAARDGLPPHLPLSPGGLKGKRVSFGEGVFAIKESRAIIASGAFVLDRHDTLEYLACPFKNGKLHETVIALDADPATINLALMALGHKSGGGIERLGGPNIPLGDRFLIYVEWDWNEELAIREFLRNVDPPWKRPNHVGVREKVREGAIKWKPGPKVRVRAEEIIFDRVNGRPMQHTEWVYNGSSFRKDRETGRHYFTATMDGVLAAVYRDPAAVFNTPLPEGREDIYYCVRDTMVPPRGTRCVVLILPAAPGEAEKSDETKQ